MTIWIEDGKLKLSTKIRDNTGNLITEIIGNEWKVRKENSWDRNYNDSALEVIDERGHVVLQVVIKEDYIQFAAKMYASNGEGFGMGSAINPDHPELGSMGYLEKRLPGEPFELVIEQIFRYPSELHLGETK